MRSLAATSTTVRVLFLEARTRHAAAAGTHGCSWQSPTCTRMYTSTPSTSSSTSTSPLGFPSYTMWGANTGVGKTLASAGIAAALKRARVPLAYLKPVQTGFPTDSDAFLVASACQSSDAVSCGPHAAVLSTGGTSRGEEKELASFYKTLFAWSHAVGPHLAVELEGRGIADEMVVSDLVKELNAFAGRLPKGPTEQSAFALVETAGGVASPMPSGKLQCDVLRPLRLPCILVGDPRLGGISATISAYETLLLRGFDVEVVVLMEDKQKPALGATPALGNSDAIRRHFADSVHRTGKQLSVVSIPSCPPPPASWAGPSRQGEVDPSLSAWLSETTPHFNDLLQVLLRRHSNRVANISSMGSAAFSSIWWPFTQHASLQEGSVQVIDSRWGEHWQVLGSSRSAPAPHSQPGEAPQLTPLYDACSSWWTQAANASLHAEVARSVAYATGRYLHVMFPENIHQPALDAASRLLSTVGSGWAKRVFFSDDGSTAIEVALKMAFRKFLFDRGGGAAPDQNEMLNSDSTEPILKLEVIGLQNAYHGDTLGAMDCVAPSVFNSKSMQAPWYTGRGLFLNPPYMALVKGEWQIVDAPEWLQLSREVQLSRWKTQEEALSIRARSASNISLAAIYKAHIEAAINGHEESSGGLLGAAIIEPVVQGAGGMLLVDPLFQKIMVQVCRAKGIPIIFDEVMTGLYRLGALSAGTQLLEESPDIACFAKLMTAGVGPGATTLTTAEVFDSFKGSSKLHALLHGHSYTAYPVGCATTVAAIDMLTNPITNPNLCHPEGGHVVALMQRSSSKDEGVDGGCSYCCNPVTACTYACGRLVPLWDADMASDISNHPLVRRVVHIGTIFATEVGEMQGAGGKIGYGAGSNAVRVARLLRSRHSIFARPIGGVVYLMVPPTTDRRRCHGMMAAVLDVLDVLASGEDKGAGDVDTDGCIV